MMRQPRGRPGGYAGRGRGGGSSWLQNKDPLQQQLEAQAAAVLELARKEKDEI